MGGFAKNFALFMAGYLRAKDRGSAIRMLNKYVNDSDDAWDKVSLEKESRNWFGSRKQGQHTFRPSLYMHLTNMHNSLKSVSYPRSTYDV